MAVSSLLRMDAAIALTANDPPTKSYIYRYFVNILILCSEKIANLSIYNNFHIANIVCFEHKYHKLRCNLKKIKNLQVYNRVSFCYNISRRNTKTPKPLF